MIALDPCGWEGHLNLCPDLVLGAVTVDDMDDASWGVVVDDWSGLCVVLLEAVDERLSGIVWALHEWLT